MGELAAPGRAREGGEAGMRWFSGPFAWSRGPAAAGCEQPSRRSPAQVAKEMSAEGALESLSFLKAIASYLTET